MSEPTDELKFLPRVATEELHCRRCHSLGIQAPTILVGNDYMEGRTREYGLNCCMDCWGRLVEEDKQTA